METETIEMRPSEKVEINKMGDAFRGALEKSIPRGNKPAPAVQGKSSSAPQSPARPQASAPQQPKPAEQAPAAQDEHPATNGATDEEVLPKNARDWKAHNEVKNRAINEAKQYKAKADELQKRLELATKGIAAQEEVKAVSARAETAEGLIKQFFISKLPQFQEHYGGLTKATVAAAVEAAGEHGDANRIGQIFALPPGKMRDDLFKSMADELPDFERAAVIGAYVDLKKIDREKESEILKADQGFAALREQQAKQEQAQQLEVLQRRAALVAHVHAHVESELEGMDAQLVTETKATTRAMIEGRLPAQGYADLLVDHARLKKAVIVEAQLREENAKLQIQVAELTSASPPANGTGGSPPMRKQHGPPDNSDLGNNYRKALNQNKQLAVQR